MGTTAVLSVHPDVPFLSPAASAISSVACLDDWVIYAISCSLVMLCRMYSIAVACGGKGGELGASTRRCFAWVTANTPLFTIPIRLDGLAAVFSAGSAMGGVSSNAWGGREPSLVSASDRSCVGLTWPMIGLSGGMF